MNKKAQLYLLAAILICLGIYGAIKINNKLVAPSDTDFSFYVDNFKGERTQVINLGYISSSQNQLGDMSALFTEFGWNTGVILIEPISTGYNVYNFRDNDITLCTGGSCEIENGALSTVGDLRFDFGGGRTIRITDLNGQDINIETTPKEVGTSFTISVDGNLFTFNNPGYKTIIFKDIDENFKKVEIV